MKKLLLLSVFVLSGCLVRTYVADRSKVNTDIQGGEGYSMLGGNPASTEGKVFKFGKVNKVAVMEIETGQHSPKDISRTPESDQGTSAASEPSTVAPAPSSYESSEQVETVMPAKDTMKQEKTYTEYTVKKGDTLQKISQKFFGTTRKWTKIYDENKDALSSPDKIYPGLVIKIPGKE